MELMKIIATNQLKLAKKVDLMNKRFKQFLAEATTTGPLDFNSFSVQEEPVEDFSAFSIGNDSTTNSSLQTVNAVEQSGSNPSIRTITSKNSNPFDPTWTSQKEATKIEEEPLPKGITKTKSSTEMFPEVVGIEEQVKQLEAEMAALDNAAPKKPKMPKKPLPTMEELAAKMKEPQNTINLPKVVKSKRKKVTDGTTTGTT